jgi:membrane-associated phospholipid phosphatase
MNQPPTDPGQDGRTRGESRHAGGRAGAPSRSREAVAMDPQQEEAWQMDRAFAAMRDFAATGPSNPLLRSLYQIVVGLAAAGILSLCYFNASKAGVGRSVDLMSAFDASVPFIPWTWWIYFPGYIGGLLMAMIAFRNLDVYYRTLGAILVAQAFCAVIFLMFPSDFPRPTDAGGGLTGEAIRWFWTVDPPNNTFPSTHVAVSVIAALGMWRDGNRARMVSLMMAIGVIVTVHTTKQHYLVDTIGGIVVALMAFRLFFPSSPARAPALA